MGPVLITHPDCLEHDPGADHLESATRLRALLAALDSAPDLRDMPRQLAPLATREQLTRAHDAEYVDAILSIRPPPAQRVRLDVDTAMSSRSAEAAARAAGAAVAAVDAVMERRARTAFAAVRPPGHHAGRGRAMGFCLFNNVVVAAYHARDRWGLTRIAIADFDAHHGNGTQAIVGGEPCVFYGSTHQYPCYPGTGRPWEEGTPDNVVNAPLIPRSRGADFRCAWTERVLPAIEAFGPELLVLSAGFDAHRADPSASLLVEREDFEWLTAALMRVAERTARGRVVSVLEGGYDPTALCESALAHIRGLAPG